MPNMNLTSGIQIRMLLDPATAGTGTTKTTVIDMQGFRTCLMLTSFGTANAGNYINAAGGTTSTVSAHSALLGTKVTSAADESLMWLEISEPLTRYLSCTVTIGSSSTNSGVIIILSNGSVLPCDNLVDNEIIGELHISPAAGAI